MSAENKLSEILNRLQLPGDGSISIDREGLNAEYDKGRSAHMSMPVKILSMLGGFFATLLFIGFLVAAGLYESETGLIVAGGIFIAGAVMLSKGYDILLLDTAAVSLFICGFVMLAAGIGASDHDHNSISIVLIIISIGVLGIVQNYVLAFFSVLIANGGVLTLIFANKHHDLVHVYLFFVILLLTALMLKESEIVTSSKKLARLYDPVRAGFTLVFLLSLTAVGKRNLTDVSWNYVWISSLGIIGMILYFISLLLKKLRVNDNNKKLLVYLLALVVLALTILSPAIPGTVLVIMLSFMVNYKSGLVMGILAFVCFVSLYYYDLDLTLLAKSGILVGTGVVFTVFYFLTDRGIQP